MASIDWLIAFDQRSVRSRPGSPLSATAFSKAGLPSFVSRRIQSSSDWGMSICTPRREDLRPPLQPFQRLDQRGKAVDPPALRVEVDELGGLAGVFAHALQVPVVDRVGNEALLVLQLHGVEGAAVGVDADEVIVFRFQVKHGGPLEEGTWEVSGRRRPGKIAPAVAARRQSASRSCRCPPRGGRNGENRP